MSNWLYTGNIKAQQRIACIEGTCDRNITLMATPRDNALRWGSHTSHSETDNKTEDQHGAKPKEAWLPKGTLTQTKLNVTPEGLPVSWAFFESQAEIVNARSQNWSEIMWTQPLSVVKMWQFKKSREKWPGKNYTSPMSDVKLQSAWNVESCEVNLVVLLIRVYSVVISSSSLLENTLVSTGCSTTDVI